MNDGKLAELRRDYIRYMLYGMPALAAKRIKDAQRLVGTGHFADIRAADIRATVFLIKPPTIEETERAVLDQIEARKPPIVIDEFFELPNEIEDDE